MIRINIVCVGKIKEKYIKDGIEEFLKRLSKYVKLDIIELTEEDDNKGIKNAVDVETQRIIDAISKKKLFIQHFAGFIWKDDDICGDGRKNRENFAYKQWN